MWSSIENLFTKNYLAKDFTFVTVYIREASTDVLMSVGVSLRLFHAGIVYILTQ